MPIVVRKHLPRVEGDEEDHGVPLSDADTLEFGLELFRQRRFVSALATGGRPAAGAVIDEEVAVAHLPATQVAIEQLLATQMAAEHLTQVAVVHRLVTQVAVERLVATQAEDEATHRAMQARCRAGGQQSGARRRAKATRRHNKLTKALDAIVTRRDQKLAKALAVPPKSKREKAYLYLLEHDPTFHAGTKPEQETKVENLLRRYRRGTRADQKRKAETPRRRHPKNTAMN